MRKRNLTVFLCVFVLSGMAMTASALPGTTSGQAAVITCGVEGAVIHYTIDGTEPTATSPIYTCPITVPKGAVVSARAWANGGILPSNECEVSTQKLSEYSLSSTTQAFQPQRLLLSGTVRRVKPDSTYNGPGTNPDWSDAYHTVTAAINASSSGDEIWVAAATYNERITLTSGRALYGGFDQWDTSRDDRDWTTNVTILDGGYQGSVVTVPPSADSGTVIDGFTIRHGIGTQYYSYRYGGGIYCRNNSSPVISNNTITGNSADVGAGINCYGSSPTIERNNITGNTASVLGGGIGCHDDGSYYGTEPTIRWNTITDNPAADGGGIFLSNNSNYGSPVALIQCNWVKGNGSTSSTIEGGGIDCSYSSADVTNNTVVGNKVYPGYPGAGIMCYGYDDYTVNLYNNISALNINGEGVFKYSETDMTVNLYNNDSYGNYNYGNYSVGFTPNSTNTQEDPCFETSGDFHLSQTSPCINTGYSGTPPGGLLDEDLDGDGVPLYTTADKGADEVVDTTGPIVTITPSDTMLHWKLTASGTTLRVYGTAVDILTGVDEVMARVDSGSWTAATYNSGTGVWYCDFSSQGLSVGTHTIQAKAKDNLDANNNWSSPVSASVKVVSVVHVKPGGTGGGTTWALAYGSVQDGINDAYTNGKEVWVAGNSSQPYVIALDPQPTPFELKDGVGIYGSFPIPSVGNPNPVFADRNPSTNETILDGDNQDCTVITIDSGSSTDTSIDGFTIRNGKAQWYGSGIYIDNASPTIANNKIIDNGYPGATFGGGIYGDGGSPRIIDNIIGQEGHGNAALRGAGICLAGVSDAAVSGNTIQWNTSSGEGAGINCGLAEDGSVTVTGNQINHNQTQSDGGGACLNGGTIVFSHNDVSSNTAGTEGGGVMCIGTDITLESNLFEDNSTGDHGGGLALHARYGMVYMTRPTNATIINNLFRRNHTDGNADDLVGGGAIHCNSVTATIVNNTFVENWVGPGDWGSIELVDNTFGGAIHTRCPYHETDEEFQTTAEVVNNIFYDNRAWYGRSLACTKYALASVSYSDSYPNDTNNYYETSGGDYTLGTRVLSLDPGFSDAEGGDFWLSLSSALRYTSPNNHSQNHADNSDVPETDIGGHLRPGAPGDSYTDMGAYESDPGNYP